MKHLMPINEGSEIELYKIWVVVDGLGGSSILTAYLNKDDAEKDCSERNGKEKKKRFHERYRAMDLESAISTIRDESYHDGHRAANEDY